MNSKNFRQAKPKSQVRSKHRVGVILLTSLQSPALLLRAKPFLPHHTQRQRQRDREERKREIRGERERREREETVCLMDGYLERCQHPVRAITTVYL